MSHFQVRDEIRDLGHRYQAGDVEALPEFRTRFGSTVRRIIRRAMRVKSARMLSPFERQVVTEARRLLGDSPTRQDLNAVLVGRVCELVISQFSTDRATRVGATDTAAGWEVCTLN